MKDTLVVKMTVVFLIIALTGPCYILKAQRGGVNKLSRVFNKPSRMSPKPFKFRKLLEFKSFPNKKSFQITKAPSRVSKWSAKQSFNARSLSPEKYSIKVKEALPPKTSPNTTVAAGQLKNKNYLTQVAKKKQTQQVSALNNIKSKTINGKVRTRVSAKQAEKEILSEVTEKSSPLLKTEAGYAVRKAREVEAAEIRLTQQSVLDDIRKTKAQNPRNQPGTAHVGNKSVVTPRGFGIPKSVVGKMLDRNYGSWNNFRKSLNREISKTPEAQKYFMKDDLTEMAKGNNPFANAEEWQGKRRRLEWDHYFEIRDGHSPYDLSNLRLIPPRTHIHKIGRKFHLAA